MFSLTRHRVLGFSLSFLSAVSLVAHAGAPAKCDKIAQDVQESVSKDPTKVLMIVEDALVINETCACEIVKAAITASKADKPMVNQIVQTAVAVAPKMTPIIIECANAVSPGAVSTADAPKVAVTSGKEAKNVNPVSVQPPADTSDFTPAPTGIRGVYLMAPAVGGLVTVEGEKKETHTTSKKTRRIIYVPISPSNSTPG